MMSPASLALRYAAFAASATAVNAATSTSAAPCTPAATSCTRPWRRETLAGLIAKYVLDRRWIFHDRPTPPRGHAVKFTRYALTGVLTTVIFWGVELPFAALGDTPWLRYAVLGLVIGYTAKYRLDRRFVFRERAA